GGGRGGAERLRTEPWPACCMCGIAARQSHATAVRLTRRTRSQMPESSVPTGLWPPLAMAALFTSTVKPPRRAAVASTRSVHARSSARAAGRETASPPAAAIPSTTAAARAASRPWTATRAPSRAHRMATCLPMPDVEPVTRTRSPASRMARRSEAVGRLQLRVLGGQHLGQVHHHLALLPGGVVLHLAVDHVDATAVGNGGEHLLGEADLLRGRAEDLARDGDLARVERPGADAAEQEGGAELILAPERVADVAERPVEGQGAHRCAGVDHARDRVVPGILLGGRARRVRGLGIGIAGYQAGGVSTADAGRLHAARCRQVGRTEADALQPRAGRAELLDVGHALRGLEDRMHEDGTVDAMLGLELRQQAVDVVDVPRPLDLGNHHDLEAVADALHQRGDVVQAPGAVQAVDPRPE